jgi:hypothetical protein
MAVVVSGEGVQNLPGVGLVPYQQVVERPSPGGRGSAVRLGRAINHLHHVIDRTDDDIRTIDRDVVRASLRHHEPPVGGSLHELLMSIPPQLRVFGRIERSLRSLIAADPSAAQGPVDGRGSARHVAHACGGAV